MKKRYNWKKYPENWIWLGAVAVLMLAACYTIYWLWMGFSTCAPGDLPWEDILPWPIYLWVYALADFVEEFIVPLVC